MTRLAPSPGPERAYASTPRQGLRPGPVWLYTLDATPATLWQGRVDFEDLHVALFPDLEHDPTDENSPGPRWEGCRPRLALVLDDEGASRHGHELTDQYQHRHTGEHHWLVAENWNLLRLDVSRWHGRSARLVLSGPTGGRGWVQSFGLHSRPREAAAVEDRVDTRRGTHSALLYSRGNTLPAACLPHGFVFATPFTNRRDHHWPYGWHRDGGTRPLLDAIGLSHWPSPWIGDRAAFHLMPWQGHPWSRWRQLGFSHDDETAHAHEYRVHLDDGISVHMVPTRHGAIVRVRWSTTRRHGLRLTQRALGRISVETSPEGGLAFTSRLQPVTPPSWDYQRLDPVAWVHGLVHQPARVVRTPWRHRVIETLEPELEIVLATSFISSEQARVHAAGAPAFETAAAQARHEWADLLGHLDIDGGTFDQRATAWSALARLHMWPNAHHEIVDGEPRYASPHTAGQPVHEGRLMVNNGFWDTARTCWPLYSLLRPRLARELVDATLEHARDQGWMPRWTAPGNVDIMPGTSSDLVFADADLQGTLADSELAWRVSVQHASTPSPHRAVGRKGIARARFTGWTPGDIDQALAWTMENATCDAALGLWARRRGGPDGEAHARWLLNRSLAHHLVYDQRIGFYQRREPDGSWGTRPERFDPAVWGRDYVETNAWGQGFHAQHDGAGLATLMGGEDALADRLDQMLATRAVTRPSMWGSHTYNTQEMNEAQNAGVGQLAISNQPAHHIAFMYLFAGRPWRTQWLTRELLDTQFTGGDIGQGYPGDEDQGEMSGWWLCCAMGLYPLFPGSGEWAITAPLLSRMRWARDDGTVLQVTAEHVEHRYIQAVTLNGEAWTQVTVPADRLRGDVHLHMVLGPEPSRWGADSRPLSTSLLHDWQPDRTPQATLDGPALLVDDHGERAHRLVRPVTLTWDEPFEARWMTLTSPDATPDLRVEVRDQRRWRDAGVRCRPSVPDATQPYLLTGCIDGVRVSSPSGARLSQIEVH